MSGKKSKTVLVTGGAIRLGRAISLHLMRHGYPVAVHYNQSAQAARGLKKEAEEEGLSCEMFQADLTDPKQVQNLFADVVRALPEVNTLINSASIFKPNTLAEVTLAELDGNMRLHAYAPLMLMQKLLRHQTQNKHVINMLDTHINDLASSHAAYLLSKKSLAQLTKWFAREAGPGLQVNGIAPGLILPPDGKDEIYLEKRAGNIPMKRRGSVEAVLQAVDFLLNQDFVTGQILYIDGGENLKHE